VKAALATSATVRALRELGEDDAGDPVIEAPLGSTGTIGVTKEGKLIVRDRAWAKVEDLFALEPVDPAGVRFADLDGDGRTDVAISPAELSLSTGAIDQVGELAALDAKDVDDAVARVLALPSDTVSPADACALLGSIKSAAALKAASAPGAEIVSFEQPDRPSWHATPIAKDAWKELQTDLADGCEMECDATRPGCAMSWAPPGIDYFLFTRSKAGKLLLWRGALYRGG
jgi:hypothetical protein